MNHLDLSLPPPSTSGALAVVAAVAARARRRAASADLHGALPPNRLAFLQRIAGSGSRGPQAGRLARAHLAALKSRIAQAAQAMDHGHPDAARLFLELARRDYAAALHALPES